MSDEYWSIDIPGLTADGAHDLAARLKGDFDLGVIVTDPSAFMVRACDRATVEVLVQCLRAGLSGDSLSTGDAHGAQSLLEDFTEWLEQAEA